MFADFALFFFFFNFVIFQFESYIVSFVLSKLQRSSSMFVLLHVSVHKIIDFKKMVSFGPWPPHHEKACQNGDVDQWNPWKNGENSPNFMSSPWNPWTKIFKSQVLGLFFNMFPGFSHFFPTPFSHVLPYVFPGVRRGDGQRPRPLRLHGDGGLDPEESGRPREKCLILILL